jgi:pilus assembly protein Flp/PilA
MMELVKRLIREEEGQGMAEYGLILALVAIAVIVALGILGGRISSKITNVSEALN